MYQAQGPSRSFCGLLVSIGRRQECRKIAIQLDLLCSVSRETSPTFPASGWRHTVFQMVGSGSALRAKATLWVRRKHVIYNCQFNADAARQNLGSPDLPRYGVHNDNPYTPCRSYIAPVELWFLRHLHLLELGLGACSASWPGSHRYLLIMH